MDIGGLLLHERYWIEWLITGDDLYLESVGLLVHNIRMKGKLVRKEKS
jgi:hypothetical protein